MPSVTCFYMSTIMTHPNAADETHSVSEVETAAAIVTCWDHSGADPTWGQGGLQPPYPHVVHWSPHKPSQRKFWHSEEEEEGEERKKKGKREERRKKKKMSPPLV